MTNIGIYTHFFAGWGGGIDFVNMVIESLASVAKKNNFKIYLFITNNEEERFSIKKNSKEFFYDKNIIYVHNHPDFFYEAVMGYSIDLILPFTFNNTIFFNNFPASISYIPDCQHRHLPYLFSAEDTNELKGWFSRIAKLNLPTLTPGAMAKKDFVKYYSANPDNIYPVPFLPRCKEIYLKDNKKKIAKYTLPRKYFIICNHFWQHKDHLTAFRALAKLIKDKKYQDIKLVCTGEMSDYRNPQYIADLKQEIKKLKLTDHVILLGRIDKIEQIEIIKNAIATIQPTLFEGGAGGLSSWEATALGVRSIVSDIPANHEIKHEPLISFFKAGSAQHLSDRMKKIIAQKKHQYPKKKLIEKSQRNIKKLGDDLAVLVKRTIKDFHARPLFSVITICRNEEKAIDLTINSIVKQKCKNYEWIVVDGKSTDRTVAILKKYKKHITQFFSLKPTGIYQAMNHAIDQAHGQYLIFINGGDSLADANALTKAEEFILHDNHRHDIYHGRCFYHHHNPDALYEPFDIGSDYCFKMGVSQVHPFFFYFHSYRHPACFIRKNLFIKYGYYDTSYQYGGDHEWFVRTRHVRNIFMNFFVAIHNVGDWMDRQDDKKISTIEKNEALRHRKQYSLREKIKALLTYPHLYFFLIQNLIHLLMPLYRHLPFLHRPWRAFKKIMGKK